MSQLAAYLSGLDWSPLLISLKTGIVATIISFFLGIYAARKVVKAGPRVKAVADGILTPPLGLPPADGAAPDGSRVFPAVAVQPQETVWSISLR